MNRIEQLAREHTKLTRRYFLQASAASAAALYSSPLLAQAYPGAEHRLLAEAVAKLEYLTREENFKTYGRGNPPPHKLSDEKKRRVGLVRDTWQLEVIADSDSNSNIENPLSKENGTALDWDAFMKLAEKHAVRFMSVTTCTNGKSPCGMGLWEGVPLRNVIWLARPKSNVRRVFYYGYHNDDPAQRFQSSLPIGRILEDPPGEHPVILCYKLNEKYLTSRRGGPVRMVVPDAYGNKAVKWLQTIVLTNNPKANDTYAEWNNDTVSKVKTCARFIHTPKKIKAGQSAPITGLAQVGMSGLSKVQYWICPQDKSLPKDDPYFIKAKWIDANVLPAPEDWGGGLKDGKLPPIPSQIEPETKRPYTWPLRNTIAHFAALIKIEKSGKYDLRCRTIDANGIAQPMPRPFPKSGNNTIQRVEIVVE